jgi:hypothetical protein
MKRNNLEVGNNKTPRRRSFGTISKAKVYPVTDGRKTIVSDLATVGFSVPSLRVYEQMYI